MDTIWTRMKADLDWAGRAPKTQSIYLHAAKDFARFHHRSPVGMGQTEVRAWIAHLKRKGTSPTRLGHHCCALSFLYRRTLGRPAAVSFLCRPRPPFKVPQVMTLGEVAVLLEAIAHPQMRMLFHTLFAVGLRIREACQLRVEDVDALRGVLHVRKAKGHFQREVPLSSTLANLLKEHLRHRTVGGPWLFSFQAGHAPDPDHVRRYFRTAVRRSGLTRRINPHLLRHTYATFLLESGIDIRVIAAILGHRSLTTTLRYTRVCTRLMVETPDVLDLLHQT